MKTDQEKTSRRRQFRREEKSFFNLPASFARGWHTYILKKNNFKDLERFCLFIGYPRSGHSLLGSLLNAHPEMLIAHEVNVLRYVRYGFPRNVLMGLLLRRDQQFGDSGREWSGYDYNVNGQFQGKTTTLRVIGDKRGRGSTKELSKDSSLLAKLRDRTGLPLAIIHHVRNPFDNIATMSRRGNHPLEASTDRYFRFALTTQSTLCSLAPGEHIETYHEDLVADPRGELRRLITFLGLQASSNYLDSCESVVFPSPRRSRDLVEWPPELIARIEDRLEGFAHLKGYRFVD